MSNNKSPIFFEKLESRIEGIHTRLSDRLDLLNESSIKKVDLERHYATKKDVLLWGGSTIAALVVAICTAYHAITPLYISDKTNSLKPMLESIDTKIDKMPTQFNVPKTKK